MWDPPPGERVACGPSTACLPSDGSAKDVDARADDDSVSVATAKATTTADFSVVSTGAAGALIAVTTVEPPMSLPVIALINEDREDRATTLFLGASLKGSRLQPALQGARG